MPKAPENRINQVYGRWRVIAENERNYSLDHGKVRLKVRNFKVECVICKWVKENVSWKNVYYDCISHNCKDNTKYIKSFNGMLNGQYGKVLIGKHIYNWYGTQHIVLDVQIPDSGDYKFKTLAYVVQCTKCQKTKKTVYQSIISGDYVTCKCHKKTNKKQTREEMMEDIDKEFEFMIEMLAEGQLFNYLATKFPDVDFSRINDDNYEI